MIGLARSLGIAVVAEGVETDVQLERLTQLGCDFAQGFLFGRPRAAAELPRMVAGIDGGRSAPTLDGGTLPAVDPTTADPTDPA